MMMTMMMMMMMIMIIIIIIIIITFNTVITSHLLIYLFIYRCGELYLLNNPRVCNRDAAILRCDIPVVYKLQCRKE